MAAVAFSEASRPVGAASRFLVLEDQIEVERSVFDESSWKQFGALVGAIVREVESKRKALQAFTAELPDVGASPGVGERTAPAHGGERERVCMSLMAARSGHDALIELTPILAEDNVGSPVHPVH
jgi:hypothetical protein